MPIRDANIVSVQHCHLYLSLMLVRSLLSEMNQAIYRNSLGVILMRGNRNRGILVGAASMLWFSCLGSVALGEDEIRVVAPNELAAMEGNDSISVAGSGGFREQQLSFSEDFALLPETHRTIVGFYSRPDQSVTTPSSARYDDILINASTTRATELGRAFTANYGDEVVKLYEGPITISTAASGPPEGPRGLDYFFPFERPYAYDPDEGNLLLEIISESGPVGDLVLDTHLGYPEPRYVGVLNPHSTSGSLQNGVFLKQFVFVPCDPDTQGDLDRDGRVDFADFLILANHFGIDTASHADGDIDCNGNVAFADFLILADNFGPEVSVANVPEPTGIVLVLLSLVFGLVTRSPRPR